MLEDLNDNWKIILFTDENKLNLSGSDGLKYCCHDICQNPDENELGPNCRARLMVQRAFPTKAPSD